MRSDLAFQAFFRRVRTGGEKGETPGYPRFRGNGRYASIPYPIPYAQGPVGCTLDTDTKRVRLSGVGEVKLLRHRPLDGTPKTASVSRSSTGKWYVCVSCECPEPAHLNGRHQAAGGH